MNKGENFPFNDRFINAFTYTKAASENIPITTKGQSDWYSCSAFG